MSDVEHDELTAQSAASIEDEQTLEQGQSETTNEDPLESIPQKFLEASKIDVIRSYQELERDRGRLANELGDLRKSQDAMTEKFQQLEAQRFSQPSQNSQPVQQVPVQQELDPVSILDSKFDDDPKEAIRQSMLQQQEMMRRHFQQQQLSQEASKASEFYHQQKQTNPDFARREPAMQQLAQQYSHIIKPEFLNSADAIKVLDLMSRGADVDFYKKAAVEDTKKHRASVVEEKRRAQSVTSNSEGDAGVDFDSMSNEEYQKHMEELYGHASKD